MNSVTSFNVDEVANRNEERLRRLELIQRGGGQGGRGSLQGDPDQVLQRFIDERRYLYHTCSNFISLPTGSQLGLVGASQVWSRAGLSLLTDSPFTCFAHGLSLAEFFFCSCWEPGCRLQCYGNEHRLICICQQTLVCFFKKANLSVVFIVCFIFFISHSRPTILASRLSETSLEAETSFEPV